MVEIYPDTARIYLDSILDVKSLSKEDSMRYVLLDRYLIAQSTFFAQPNLDDTVAFYVKNYFEDHEDWYSTALANLFTGSLLYYQQKYEESLSDFRKAQKYSNKYGYKMLEAQSLSCIAILYYDLGLLDKSLSYFFKALQLLDEVGYSSPQVETYRMLFLRVIGACYLKLGNFEESEKYYKLGLELNENKPPHSYVFLADLASLKIRQKEYPESIRYSMLSFNDCRSVEDSINSFATLIQAYDLMGKKDSSKIYVSQIEEMIPSAKDYRLLKFMYNILATSSKQRGEYKKALEYTALRDSAREESPKEATIVNFVEVDNRYIMNNLSEKVQEQNKNMYLSVIIVFVVLVVIVVLVIFFHKQITINFSRVDQQIGRIKKLQIENKKNDDEDNPSNL